MGTKRKQKGYSFNPLDHSFFGGDLEFNPSGVLDIWDKKRKEERELEVIKGLLAKQDSPEAQNKRLGILNPDEGGEYTDEENAVLKKIFDEGVGEQYALYRTPENPQFDKMKKRLDLEGISEKIADRKYDDDYYSGMLASEKNLDMYDDSPDKQDKLDIGDRVGYGNQVAWDSQRQDPIRQNEKQLSAPESSPDSTPMSPAMKRYAVGLLKDFLTPQEDDPPQQVRGAGIIRGGGTPFPSLLAKRQKPPRYTPKGLI